MTAIERQYYSSHEKLYLSVDCIVFALNEGSLQLLLVKRDFEPFKGEWSLMGGFVRAEESVDKAAQRVLRDLTGLDGVYMHQIGTFGNIDRDPGERVVSVAYSALLNYPDVNHEAVKAHNASWFDIHEVPSLILALIGGFNNWNGDVELTPSAYDKTWTGTLVLESDSDWKFRFNNDWGINLGGSVDNLVPNGDNLNCQAGTYEITLDLSKLPYSCTVVKK